MTGMRRLRSPEGAVAVEFALLAPLLLTIMFGIIECSLVLYDKAVLTNAGREGARVAIIFRADPDSGAYAPASDDEIADKVGQYLHERLVTFGGPAEAVVTTAFDDLDGSGDLTSGDQRSVTVAWTYSFLVLPNFVTSLSGGLPMNATTRMRME
jgi:hypothetical protein